MINFRYKQYGKKLYGPFLCMEFNCLKAAATSRRQLTFYHDQYMLIFFNETEHFPDSDSIKI